MNNYDRPNKTNSFAGQGPRYSVATLAEYFGVHPRTIGAYIAKGPEELLRTKRVQSTTKTTQTTYNGKLVIEYLLSKGLIKKEVKVNL